MKKTSKENLAQIFGPINPRRLKEIIKALLKSKKCPDVPVPPAKGCRLLTRHAFWRCDNGRWNFVEVNTWLCPPDKFVDTECIVLKTEDRCQ